MFKGKIIKGMICLLAICMLVNMCFAEGQSPVKGEEKIEVKATKTTNSDQKLIQYLKSDTNTNKTHWVPDLKAKDESKYGYRERGNRYEGFYISDVAIPNIDVVGVLQGKLYYELDSNECVEIFSEIVKDKTIYITAQAIPLKTYYRMDAELLPNRKLEWPIEDVILPNTLSSKRIGLMGWYMSDENRIYVPLKTKARVNRSKNDDIIRVVFRSTVDLENIYYAWLSYETQASTGWQQNLRNSSRAGMPIVVTLKHKARGKQLLIIAGKVMNTKDKWVKKQIDLIVR